MAGRLSGLRLPRLSGGASPAAFGAGRTLESYGGGAGREAYGAGRISPDYGTAPGTSEIFKGLAEAGETVAITALRGAQADRAAKKRDDILAGRRMGLQAGVDWDKRLLDAKMSAPADAAGFTTGLMTSFKEFQDTTLAGLEGEQKQIVSDELLQLGGTLQREATNFEADRRLKAREKDAKASIDIAANAIFARPQDHGRILSGLLSDIAESDLPEFAKEELAASTTGALAGALWSARIERDPYQARDALLSGDSDSLQGLEFRDRQTLLGKAESTINGIEVEQRRAQAEARAEASERQAVARAAQEDLKSTARLHYEDVMAAAERGEVIGGDTARLMIAAFGPEEGGMRMDRINIARETAGIQKRFGGMAPGEIQRVIDSRAPQGAGYAIEAKAQDYLIQKGQLALRERQEEFKAALTDEITAATMGRTTGREEFEARVRQTYPEGQAETVLAQVEKMRQAGTVAAGFGDKSPGEIASELTMSDPQGADFDLEAKLSGQMATAAQRELAARKQDPAAATANANPEIANGLASNDPKRRADALRKSWDFQGRTYELAERDRRLFTKESGALIVDQFKTARTTDERIALLAGLTTELGDTKVAAQVMSDLERAGMPGSARLAVERLTEGDYQGATSILGGITLDPDKQPKLGESTTADITSAVDALIGSDSPASITARVAAMSRNPDIRARAELERSEMIRLAKEYANGGLDSADAALKAQRAVQGDVDTVGGADLGLVRIPSGVDRDAMLAGMEAARANLQLPNLTPPPPPPGDGNAAQAYEFAKRDYEREREVMRQTAFWTESEGGYVLLNPRTGKLLEYYTAEQLLELGARSRAPVPGPPSAVDPGLVLPGLGG